MKAARTFLALTVAVAFVVLPAIPARAGGGCHDAAVTDVKGTRVDLKGLCFVQTVLRVRPGQAVTWTNYDDTNHLVTGVGLSWGSLENLGPRQSVTYTFGNPGVYPYACMIHAGMVGAVVVGNGGIPRTDSSGAGVLPVLSSPSVSGATSIAGGTSATRAPASSTGPWRVIALVTLGLLAAAAAGLGIRRLGVRRSQARAGIS